jgi:hypothetical protein
MQSTRVKLLLLGARVALWALILVFRNLGGGAPPRSGSDQPRARAARAAAGEAIPRLKTDLATRPRAPYPAEVHNIFSRPLPPPLPVQAGGPGGSAAAPPPPPPDPFQEGAKQLRYVGFLQSGDTATAFLVRGQEVHTVPVGGLVGGQFRVVEVRDDSVLLGSPTGDKQVRLSLAGDTGTSLRAPEVAVPGPAPPVGPPRPPGAIPGPAPRRDQP